MYFVSADSTTSSSTVDSSITVVSSLSLSDSHSRPNLHVQPPAYATHPVREQTSQGSLTPRSPAAAATRPVQWRARPAPPASQDHIYTVEPLSAVIESPDLSSYLAVADNGDVHVYESLKGQQSSRPLHSPSPPSLPAPRTRPPQVLQPLQPLQLKTSASAAALELPGEDYEEMNSCDPSTQGPRSQYPMRRHHKSFSKVIPAGDSHRARMMRPCVSEGKLSARGKLDSVAFLPHTIRPRATDDEEYAPMTSAVSRGRILAHRGAIGATASNAEPAVCYLPGCC